LVISLALGSCALLAVDRLNATFSFWSRSISIDFARGEISDQGIYKLLLKTAPDSKRIFPSQIRLFDNGGDPFSYTPTASSLSLAEGKGLFTIQKDRSLLVAWPTFPVVSLAKDQGVLKFPALLPSWIITAASVLLGCSFVALLCCLPYPVWRPPALALRLIKFIAWSLRLIGRHPAIVLSLPSVYLLSVYPPLWKDVDAFGQLIPAANVTNIYHFPALFCFGARLFFWFGDLFGTWKWPDLSAPQAPTLEGIYFLVMAQNLALILSLALLCKTLTRRDWLRGAFVAGLFFSSGLYANVLLCGSEAWSVFATISLFTFGLRLYSAQGSETSNWIGYLLSLVLAIGSRHVNLLLGFWLIGLCLIASLLRIRFRAESGLPSRPFLKACTATVMLFVAACSNNVLEQYLASRFGVEPRSTLGHTLSDRIGSFLDQLRPAERAGLAQKLAAQTPEHIVKLAIEDQAAIGSFYKGTQAALDTQLRAANFSGEHLQAEKDRAILKATLAYLKSFHPVLLRVIWKDFLRGFSDTNNFSLARGCFAENSFVGTYRLDNPSLWIPLNVLPSTFLPETLAWLDRSAVDGYLESFKRPRLNTILFLNLISLGFCFWKRRCVFSNGIPALTILLTGIAVFGASMICVYFLVRYALPLWICLLIALGLVTDSLFEGRKAHAAGE
jgi:hypothetical protein